MIEKLEQLTVDQFINLICGDSAVLVDNVDKISQEKVTAAIRNIVFEYRDIADPAGAKLYLSNMEELAKARISSAVFAICENLIGLNEHERVREVLIEYGINAKSMNNQRVTAEVKSRLERMKRTIKNIENEYRKENHETTDIRREFDAQTAAMMAHFKFHIDTSCMRACVYAHLVARYNREIKAQLVAIKGK